MLGRLRQFVMPRPAARQSADSSAIVCCDEDGRAHEIAVRRHPQSRRLRLIVDDAGARVTAPMRASAVSIERFVAEHRRWILRQLARHSAPSFTPPIAGIDDWLTLRGARAPVVWFDSELPRVEREAEGAIRIGVPLASPRATTIAGRALRSWLVAEATRDIAGCNEAALARVDARASRVSVRPLRTLWGSISVDGSMRIDLALLLAPPRILDYVVVHEACHRHERNHGARFWAHVARAHPDFPEHRRWLREHGAALKSELARWLT